MKLISTIKKIYRQTVRFTVTLFLAGEVKYAPGTVGSFVSTVVAYFCALYFGQSALVIISLILFFIGWLGTYIYERQMGKHDPSEIVIDEACGMFLCLAVVPVEIGWYALGFVIFRFFDIVKIYPANIVDRQKTPFSVMFDDVIAGGYSIIALLLIKFMW